MKKTKFFFKKIKYVDDADFCFSKGGVSSALPHSLPHRSSMRIASHTDAAGYQRENQLVQAVMWSWVLRGPSPSPFSWQRPLEGPSDVNSFPSFLWVRGVGSGRGGLAGIWTTLWPLPQSLTRAPQRPRAAQSSRSPLGCRTKWYSGLF